MARHGKYLVSWKFKMGNYTDFGSIDVDSVVDAEDYMKIHHFNALGFGRAYVAMNSYSDEAIMEFREMIEESQCGYVEWNEELGEYDDELFAVELSDEELEKIGWSPMVFGREK